jgi:two-component system nitrogen regulation sensor histidine kinase NtrY
VDWKRWLMVVQRWRWSHQLILLLILSSLASCLATLAAFSGWFPFSSHLRAVNNLLIVDFLLLFALLITITRNLWQLRRDLRQTRKTSLKQRFVLLFAGIALVPSLVMFFLSAYFLNFGLQAWFNQRIRTTMQESLAVAEFYVNDQEVRLRGDALAIGRALLKQVALNTATIQPENLRMLLGREAGYRGIADAMLISNATGEVLARTQQSYLLDVEQLDDHAIRLLKQGEVVLAAQPMLPRMRALVNLPEPIAAVLQITRTVEPSMAKHIAETRSAVQQYEQFKGRRTSIQITIVLIYIVVTLLLLMITVWFGIMSADRFSRPIQLLAQQVNHIRMGEQLPEQVQGSSIYEVDSLTRSFRRMFLQIFEDQLALKQANQLLDERRQFIETTLTSVSAGVLRVNRDGVIEYANPAAEKDLLRQQLVGMSLMEVLPMLQDLLSAAMQQTEAVFEQQIAVEWPARNSSGPIWRHYFVRIGREGNIEASNQGPNQGYVITLDDITDYLMAQKRAAWSEVARRLAHEIKNPLTPIQLASERLRKKFQPSKKADQEDFEICVSTILRQAEDIRLMIDEFSLFARMPSPNRKREDFCALVRSVHRMMQLGHEKISFTLDLPDDPLWLTIDAQQLRQALSNLYRNAVEALEVASVEAPSIQASLSLQGGGVCFALQDNGGGFSDQLLTRALEPYVTSKTKGTGLGLAIVSKIVEDHHGRLELSNMRGGSAEADGGGGSPAESKGAVVRIFLPVEVV